VQRSSSVAYFLNFLRHSPGNSIVKSVFLVQKKSTNFTLLPSHFSKTDKGFLQFSPKYSTGDLNTGHLTDIHQCITKINLSKIIVVPLEQRRQF